ncbi:MAG: HEPN domain-containing protein [Treponema sp.]|jgi:HEPN domain-containing protein|nr:HEPN domain-containing protein [Treponema sp.]
MERYEAWIDRAKSSYELSKAKINNIIYFEDLCYQAQQAVEKSLKGFLIYFGVEPEFTHNISKLLSELEKCIEIPDNIKETIELTNYAVQTRYPADYKEITAEVLIFSKNSR